MFPEFRSCLVCDLIRQEIAGKLTLLGYFGVCPNVDIGVAQLSLPTVLTFLISGDPGDGHFFVAVGVFDEMDGRLISTTTEMPMVAVPNAMTVLVPSLILTFGRAGPYSVRLFIEGQERFRAEFRVSSAAP